MKLRTSTRARLRALTATAGLAAALVATVSAPPAESAPRSFEPAACPDVYPINDLTPSQPISALTVSRGNTPDEYSGEVIGVIADGIAPDIDMIMVNVDLAGQPDGVTGIWAGMSGSPVYAADGRLIGAVSYGLAFGPSPVAGVTPAADMKALLGDEAASVDAMSGPRHVALPQRMQQRLVTDGLATTSAAGEGLDRLPLPVGVSGPMNDERLSQLQDMMGMSGVQLYRAGAAPAAPAPADLIFPGSNLAASISYGDFSVVGTGTTTMVCDGQVVGWGHYFNFTGAATWAMHGADAIYIQDDPTEHPFKVSNATGPVGEITGDHMAGISGPLGELPNATLVESTATHGDRTRTGDTYVSAPELLPDLAASAVVANEDIVIDRFGPGSSRMHFVVEGHTADGSPFTLERTNRFVSNYDLTYDTVLEMLDDLSTLLRNRFTDVTIDEVRATTRLSTEERAFSVAKVERKIGTRYTTLTSHSVVKARAGSSITLRLTLNSNKFGTMHAIVKAKVPNARVGSSGTLTVGNLRLTSGQPGSFTELITELGAAPRNDQLRAAIVLATRNGTKRTTGAPTTVNDVVHGTHSFQLTIVR